MEENKKTDPKNEELDPETMEEVSGGSSPFPTKIKHCKACGGKTVWIYSGNGYACSQCGNRSFGGISGIEDPT